MNDARAALRRGAVHFVPISLDEVLAVAELQSRADRVLWSMGERPVPISKYCVGLAMVQPHLPANRWNRTLRRYFRWEPDRTPVRALVAGRSAGSRAGTACMASSPTLGPCPEP